MINDNICFSLLTLVLDWRSKICSATGKKGRSNLQYKRHKKPSTAVVQNRPAPRNIRGQKFQHHRRGGALRRAHIRAGPLLHILQPDQPDGPTNRAVLGEEPEQYVSECAGSEHGGAGRANPERFRQQVLREPCE